MHTPVGVIARLIPFQEATIVYFCRAVSGNLGSGEAGGGGSLGPKVLLPPPLLLEVNFPSSHPILPADRTAIVTNVNTLYFLNHKPLYILYTFFVCTSTRDPDK